MSEPSYLAEIRNSYDTVADSYHDLLKDAHDSMPFDRAMLAAFAERAQGTVADIGCGPGRITTRLADLGLSVFGIDLSPEMIEVARREHPRLRFDVGSMTALDLADGSLGGVVAWYSIIHLPQDELPGVFAEFFRVLEPGGQLLLAFKSGDERRHLSHAYGHDVSLDVYWMPVDRVAKLAEQAGFTEVARLERAASTNEKGPQGYYLARKQ
ncbi:class I SAM-dependent DNA methyltransferase [Kibdelosporangium phytohabitans]|uniref:Methyltransferase n=1 Tax=Kibdelosporangium phytohabitans TaxID=860235 RepID=A0A0N9IAN6_9PSEU|nr:class I SAM-dependent methyltransferase [Kibdelosporangium phytohabitans]ALG13420.1 methyltransferase [Kibdelosporangium phytohabitans]MBE1465226.1 ubiquinone/menaquinone biosynthesis C-methylase UbiE [Kibdelosporangium phytohabitans]